MDDDVRRLYAERALEIEEEEKRRVYLRLAERDPGFSAGSIKCALDILFSIPVPTPKSGEGVKVSLGPIGEIAALTAFVRPVED